MSAIAWVPSPMPIGLSPENRDEPIPVLTRPRRLQMAVEPVERIHQRR